MRQFVYIILILLTLPSLSADSNTLWHRAWLYALRVTELSNKYAQPQLQYDHRLPVTEHCAGLYVLEVDLDRKGRPILKERVVLALDPTVDNSGMAYCTMVHEALHATHTRRRILDPEWFKKNPDSHKWMKTVLPKACLRWENQ